MNKEIISTKHLKKIQFISTLFLLIIKLCSLISPYIMQQTIDIYIPNQQVNSTILGIILFVSLPCICFGAKALYIYFCYKTSRNEGAKITINVITNLLRQNLSFFDHNNSAELASKANSNAYDYVYFHILDIPEYITNIINCIVLFVIIFRINIYIALIQLLFIPFFIMPMKKLGNKLNENTKEYLDLRSHLHQSENDAFRYISFIKCNNLENDQISKIKKNNDAIIGIWGKISALESTLGIWSTAFVPSVCKGITFGLGAFMIISKKSTLSIGELISTYSYASMLYSCFDIILRTNIKEYKENANVEKLSEYLALKGEQNGTKSIDEIHKIEISNLSFQYVEGKNVLNNINLEVNKNDWIGIVGESGKGKSTIFKLLLGLYPINEGSIKYNGINIDDLSLADLRKHISLVSQDISIFPGTIKENLLLVNKNATEEEINRAITISCLDTFISRLDNGIDTVIGESGKLMSGGERQRLSLAQALLRNSDVLLLDEASANLDEETEAKIIENLDTFKKETGITIISISHRTKFLNKANKIYEIESLSN